MPWLAPLGLLLGMPSCKGPSRSADAGAHEEPWRGQVEALSRARSSDRLLLCDGQGQQCLPLESGASVPAGARLRTDAGTRARLRLQDGTVLSLERLSELVLDAGPRRAAKLLEGELVADVAHREGEPARVDTALGSLAVLGTQFALRVAGERAVIDVSRGRVQLEDRAGRQALVLAGEQGSLQSGQPPSSVPNPSMGEALAWSEGGAPEADRALPAALGVLEANKPGESQARDGAVVLQQHSVKVRISGAVARTEIEEVFLNETDDVLEGLYRFPLPADATVDRLALDVGGRLEEAAFVDRERAAAIWRGAIVNFTQVRPKTQDPIVWVPGPWHDPALLEWQRGNRFELHVFPIPKRGTRRVVLGYTQDRKSVV